MDMRVSSSAFKNVERRIGVWIVGVLVMLFVATIRHDLVGAMIGFWVLIFTLLCDEYVKERYWFNIREAAPQTHEATITELFFGFIVLLAFYLFRFGYIGFVVALVLFVVVILTIVL